jgi:hypothetical protein
MLADVLPTPALDYLYLGPLVGGRDPGGGERRGVGAFVALDIDVLRGPSRRPLPPGLDRPAGQGSQGMSFGT